MFSPNASPIQIAWHQGSGEEYLLRCKDLRVLVVDRSKKVSVVFVSFILQGLKLSGKYKIFVNHFLIVT